MEFGPALAKPCTAQWLLQPQGQHHQCTQESSDTLLVFRDSSVVEFGGFMDYQESHTDTDSLYYTGLLVPYQCMSSTFLVTWQRIDLLLLCTQLVHLASTQQLIPYINPYSVIVHGCIIHVLCTPL